MSSNETIVCRPIIRSSEREENVKPIFSMDKGSFIPDLVLGKKSLSVCPYVCLSVHLYIRQSNRLYVRQPIRLSGRPSILSSICPSVGLLYVRLSVFPLCLSVCLIVCLSFCPTVCLNVCVRGKIVVILGC